MKCDTCRNQARLERAHLLSRIGGYATLIMVTIGLLVHWPGTSNFLTDDWWVAVPSWAWVLILAGWLLDRIVVNKWRYAGWLLEHKPESGHIYDHSKDPASP